ncbi:ATPase [Phenylobacterium immobile]|uniref:ATPase n=1 Tax=Phenylobacterium immobile TaxID=21 RepID=UPI000ABE4ADC|nr:ATPase [Phenylobacterium immobile]
MRSMILAIGLLCCAGAARAEVTDRSAAGFEVVHTFETTKPPAIVWAGVLRPAMWWSKDHTWSGAAENLSMDPDRGCFCETLPKGEVRHLSIVFKDDSTHQLRLEGALGPLVFTGATGHLGFVVTPTASGSKVTLTYDVGGYAKGGLAETWAGPVDAVLGEQMARLKALLDPSPARRDDSSPGGGIDRFDTKR